MLGRQTTLDLTEAYARHILRDLKKFLEDEEPKHPHITHPEHIPNQLARRKAPTLCHLKVHRRYETETLVLNRQNAEFAHDVLSSVIDREDEKAPRKTLGRVTASVSHYGDQ